jgi:hypothetical protein
MSLLVIMSLAFSTLLINGAAHLDAAIKLRRITYALQTEMEITQALPGDRLIMLDGSNFASGEGSIKVAPVAEGLLLLKLQLNRQELLTLRSSR